MDMYEEESEVAVEEEPNIILIKSWAGVLPPSLSVGNNAPVAPFSPPRSTPLSRSEGQSVISLDIGKVNDTWRKRGAVFRDTRRK